MCWISKHIEKQIATKDIVVYKIIFSDFTSSITFFNYEPNKLYTENIHLLPYKGSYIISKGFHSYSGEVRCKKFNDNSITLCNGFFDHLACHNVIDKNIVKCIIPKGSVYYINKRKEIVSNQITLTDKTIPLSEIKKSIFPIKLNELCAGLVIVN